MTSALKITVIVLFLVLAPFRVWGISFLPASGYSSCTQVLQTNSAARDGSYVITVPGRGTFTIYCSGFASGSPKEYITLESGRSKNFAVVYDRIGSENSCQEIYPAEFYANAGRTEFYKVRLRLTDLSVDLNDFTFAVTYGSNNISFGSAGDMYASSSICPPLGQFSIDLQGTPFVISPDVIWQWTGRFADGNTNGQAKLINSTYVGCYQDASDRLLPSSLLQDAQRMTPDYCIQHCSQGGFLYAGLEYYHECYCGDVLSKHPKLADSSCNYACSGDHSKMCGGSWTISVFSTDTGQTLSGHCGGYPGNCFPTLVSQPNQPVLRLAITSRHPCLNGACLQSEVCVSVSATAFQCLRGSVCNAAGCNNSQQAVVINAENCPMGMLAVQCACVNNCTGARFNGDVCLAQSGKPRVKCVEANPGHVRLTNFQGTGSVSCPNSTTIVGCSYWDSGNRYVGNGIGSITANTNICLVSGCAQCSVYARCLAYICGCQNGATCNPLSGQCNCLPGYYGDLCENFDYCSYYEDQRNDHQPACSAGTCKAIPGMEVRTYGGNGAGSACIFPFDFDFNTYTQCVDNNGVGPPFACGTYFDGADDYIDLGTWNPGPVYTIAAWISPSVSDNRRRTIVGGVHDCRDFGLYMMNGALFAYYIPPDQQCTSGLEGGTYELNKWYLVAVTSNGTYLSIYVNGAQQNTQVRPYFLGTSLGTRIGSSACCGGENFKGLIKSVKMWKRSLSLDEINTSMIPAASYNSTNEALYHGLITHYELGQVTNVSCQGTDHGGEDWILQQEEEVSGVHCNVNKLDIPEGIVVHVAPYNGSMGGSFEVYAEEIHISGFLDATGRGYRGGRAPDNAGQDGNPGESYHDITTNASGSINLNLQSYQPHRGGGGGGWGGAANHPTSGNGSPGGGGGYASAGMAASGTNIASKGQGGQIYGNQLLDQLYLGSGGGSGGNAADLTLNPKGGRGGNGGGIIGLYARGIALIHGYVSVAGENGQGDVGLSTGCASCPASCLPANSSIGARSCYGNSSSACWDKSGPGGGGSGGSLYIVGNYVEIDRDKLWYQGGTGGLGGTGGCGGDGSYGRIRVDAVTFVGSMPPNSLLKIFNSTTRYQDLSVSGQKLIQYTSNLQYGNEIYRGCFTDDVNSRHFAFTLPVTQDTRQLMTPQYCTTQCRQRGYSFSAVEYGFECYCDNTFQYDLKRPDGECNQACTGDSQQFCGAPNRMSVYGPRPFGPVEGMNGAEQQCTPWCLTGNIYSQSPNWGFCDLASMTSTSYQIQCQCPDGFEGSNCDQVCPEGMWGAYCAKVCICNATNTQSCNPRDGTCNCQPGYWGGSCDMPCPTGTFGLQCRGNCSCLDTAECDYKTGQCICKPGWKGERCNFPCQPGTYGLNCSNSCVCNHGSCSPEDGTCSCDSGFKLPFCVEYCDPFNYGPNCLYDCDCHSQPCDKITGLCLCGPGFSGFRCERICPHGYYGQNCNSQCPCQNDAGCDHIDGQCFCAPGWSGENCTVACSPWKYGRDCAEDCPCIQQNTQSCNSLTGVCVCNSGFTGESCSQPCPSGYFGQECANTCSCYNNATCDAVTGQCQCPPGLTGPLCQTGCPTGMYGPGCAQTCPTCSSGVCSKADGTCICGDGGPCICPPGYYGSQCSQLCTCMHGKCENTSGSCDCDSGWRGSHCDTPCADGTYGKFCVRQCQCRQGTCSKVDGSCTCPPGFQGAVCDQTCPFGSFGVNCLGVCQSCGVGSSPTCNPVTGDCLCLPGFTGLLCDRPCPTNTYGQNCSNICSCVNGYCDVVDGTCECTPGFTGNLCNHSCTDGIWGPDCRNTCLCKGHSTTCDFVSGECSCTAGFTGEACDQSCPEGTFGLHCSGECKCDLSMSQCSPIDGSCICLPGFSGTNCTLCPQNRFGLDCSQICQCSGHGSCDNIGRCDCEPGYTGDQCQMTCVQNVNYGKNCNQVCDCSNQMCDFRDGLCQCDAGKTGQRCDQNCDANHYGLQCAQPCLCQNGAICNPVTGECQCQPGWDGIYCDQSCEVGRYGQGCSLLCNCLIGTPCHPTSGQCLCRPGFMGAFCNTSCPDGFWDVNCVTRCSMHCYAGCLPEDGQCKCTSDSCPSGYVCGNNGICMSALAATSSGLDAGQIAGIVIGFILAMVVAGLGVFIVMRKRNSHLILRLLNVFHNQTVDPEISGSVNPMYNTGEKEATSYCNTDDSSET